MMEQDLPIDIHTSKLVDWLVSRRHVKKNWPEALQKVREKINNAIQDMPEHPEIIKLLSGDYINYFHCLRIVGILQETEKDSKNIFGWYTSQRMKDWKEVIRLYESDNVNLVEISQFFVRNVTYEIPSIKQQIAKCEQIQVDCDRKEEQFRKGSASAKDRYFSSCKKIGIKGENVREELLGLLNELPQEFHNIGVQVKKLEAARQLYSDFLDFTLPSKHAVCLPLMKFIIEHGDVTVYEWKFGEAPIKIEKQEIDYKISSPKEEKSDEIDFGVESNSNEIDFGDENNSNEIDFGEVDLKTGDIDWGNLETVESATPEIDWEIESGNDSFEIVVESSGVEGGIAKGDEALSLLYNESTRITFINELLELEGFLTQRRLELGEEENALSMSQFSFAPNSLQCQNQEVINAFLSTLSNIIHSLTSTKMQHLYLISNSSRYVDRLSESLKSSLHESEKLLSSISTVVSRREDAIKLQHKLNLQLKVIVPKTKELQKNVEKQISLKYKNRPVNLMGIF